MTGLSNVRSSSHLPTLPRPGTQDDLPGKRPTGAAQWLDLAQPVVRSGLELTLPQEQKPSLEAPAQMTANVRPRRAEAVGTGFTLSPAAYERALQAARTEIAAGDLGVATASLTSLRKTPAGVTDYRVHAEYALLMERLVDAQDAANVIGRVHVSKGLLGLPEVASERLVYLRGMLDGMLTYLGHLDTPATADRIAAANGEDSVTAGRASAAQSIVWAVDQISNLLTNMTCALVAQVGHSSLLSGLERGEFDLTDPTVVERFQKHLNALKWPHLGAVKGDILLDEAEVVTVVRAWATWGTAQRADLWSTIADVRPRLLELAPQYADAIAHQEELKLKMLM